MLIRNRTNVYDFNFHVVIVTKYRKELFNTKEYVNDMKGILYHLAGKINVSIEHLEVMPDHVHLMLSFPPKYSPSEIVKNLKGSSARLWFKQHPETKKQLYGGHLWSPSFFISTIGNVSKRIVSEYIESQMQKSKNGTPLRDLSQQ